MKNIYRNIPDFFYSGDNLLVINLDFLEVESIHRNFLAVNDFEFHINEYNYATQPDDPAFGIDVVLTNETDVFKRPPINIPTGTYSNSKLAPDQGSFNIFNTLVAQPIFIIKNEQN